MAGACDSCIRLFRAQKSMQMLERPVRTFAVTRAPSLPRHDVSNFTELHLAYLPQHIHVGVPDTFIRRSGKRSICNGAPFSLVDCTCHSLQIIRPHNVITFSSHLLIIILFIKLPGHHWLPLCKSRSEDRPLL